MHDLHNDYPLAPERVAVGNDMLSNYAKTLKESMKNTEVKKPKKVQSEKQIEASRKAKAKRLAKQKLEHQSKGAIVEKLVPNLNNKYKYVVHYRNLQYYLQKGLRITKWHRILQYKQSKWLEPYIMFNNHKRTQARNSFE